MNLEEFPMCCGVGVLTCFDDEDEYDEEKQEYVSTLTTSRIKDYITTAKANKQGLLVAITADYQTEAAKKIEEAGFKKLLTFKNPIHRSTLVLWHKALNHKKKKKVKK